MWSKPRNSASAATCRGRRPPGHLQYSDAAHLDGTARMTMGRPARAERLSFGGYLAISIYFTWPLLASGARLGISDWDALLFQHASVIRSVFEYGQMPFWNPWFCGGDVLWQNPQAPLLTPTYLFALVLPLAVAMKLNILVHYLAGFMGMHLLLDRSLPALVCAGGLSSSARPLRLRAVLHCTCRRPRDVPAVLLSPWMLFFFLAALETGALRHAVGTARTDRALHLRRGNPHHRSWRRSAWGSSRWLARRPRRDWRPIVLLAATGVCSPPCSPRRSSFPCSEFVTDPRLVDIRYFLPGPDRLRQHAPACLHRPHQYPRLRLPGQLTDGTSSRQLPRTVCPAPHRGQLRVGPERSAVVGRNRSACRSRSRRSSCSC